MRKVVSIVALAALAACGQGNSTTDNKQAAAAPAVAAGPHSNAAPGTYTQVKADGSMVITHLEADGTYTDWVAGAMTESGKWAVKDNKTCFTPADGKERCSSDGPMGADGSFTVTPDEGTPYTVTKTA
jgi:hypothetical protein